MPTVRRAALGAWVGLLALLLSGCATGGPPQAALPGRSGGPVTVTDMRGAQIRLVAPAGRVVALEWNVAEHAVALGVMPVGVADVIGYRNWVRAEPLAPSVVDVGVRGEPRVDVIAALRPDLVLATDELPPAAVARIETIAPVAFVSGGDTRNGIGQMRRNLGLVATLVDRQDRAAQLLAAFDAKLARGRTLLAGRAGQSFVFADGFLEGGRVRVRPYAPGSLLSDVTEQLGLHNAWTRPGDGVYGLAETEVSGLSAVGRADCFLYVANDADGGDPFASVLAHDPGWAALPVVRAGQVHRLPDGIWMFGGPTSMGAYVDAVVAALES